MIHSIFEQFLIFLPLILGAYVTLSLLKLPDFSIESAFLFGAVGAFLAKDMPLPFVILSALSGGMIVGIIVSFLNQILNIPFLLAAIVTNGLIHGATQFFLGTSTATVHFLLPFKELTLMITIGIVLLAGLTGTLRSQLGFSLAIYGNNPLFFRHQGISTRYVVFTGVTLAHGCAGMSGFLFAQSNGFVDLTMNIGLILMCLTAIMIGKFFLPGRKPNLLIPVIGLTCFFLIQQSLLRAGLNLKYFNAFQACFVLVILYYGHRKHAVSIDHLGV